MRHRASSNTDNEPFLDLQKTPLNNANPNLSDTQENGKVAVKRGFSVVELALHFSAVAIIALITALTFTNYFWQDLDQGGQLWDGTPVTQASKLRGLQFVAKLHELLMQASLSAMVLYYTHKLLIGSRGIPFALIDSPYGNNSPNMLFRMPFWRSGFGQGRRHTPLGLLVLVAGILSVVLGPSSAVIMIPSLDWWQTKNAFQANDMTIWFEGSASDVWHPVLDSSLFSNASVCFTDPAQLSPSCPFQGYMDVMKWLIGYVETGADTNLTVTEIFSHAQRSISRKIDPNPVRANNSVSHNNFISANSYTTSLSERLVLSVGSFWNYVERNNVGKINEVARPRLRVRPQIQTYQPLVHVVCDEFLWNDTSEDVPIPPSANRWNDGNYLDHPWTIAANSSLWDNLPDVNPRFSFFKDTRNGTATSLNAVAILPISAENPTSESYQGTSVVPCSIDARWAANQVSYQPTDSSVIQSNLSNPLVIASDHNVTASAIRKRYGISDQPIDLALSWAQLLDFNWTDISNFTGDSRVYSNNGSALSSTMGSLLEIPIELIPITSSTPPFNVASFQVPNTTTNDPKSAIAETISSLLGIIINDAISRTAYLDPVPLLDLGPTTTNTPDDQFILLVDFLRSDRYPCNGTCTNPGSYKILLDVDRYGYAYGLSNPAAKASIACLFFYTLLVLIHVAYISYSRLRGWYARTTCWDDIGSLVALAVNSAPTDKLYGTSADIEEKDIWLLNVKVRDFGERHLELAFGDDGRIDSTEIKAGKKYC